MQALSTKEYSVVSGGINPWVASIAVGIAASEVWSAGKKQYKSDMKKIERNKERKAAGEGRQTRRGWRW